MGCSVANGTLCAVEHVAYINLGSILHLKRTAAEIKLSLSIAEKENKAILAERIGQMFLKWFKNMQRK